MSRKSQLPIWTFQQPFSSNVLRSTSNKDININSKPYCTAVEEPSANKKTLKLLNLEVPLIQQSRKSAVPVDQEKLEPNLIAVVNMPTEHSLVPTQDNIWNINSARSTPCGNLGSPKMARPGSVSSRTFYRNRIERYQSAKYHTLGRKSPHLT